MQLYRIDQMIAAVARKFLWVTDAYFVGSTSYTEALGAAAQEGVDVRLLVPGSSDLPMVRTVSRAAYRPLLEAGIRVFEWQGSMLHAKTAVIDDQWTRIGSTNLNPASWLGNWELDVAIDHPGTAQLMRDMYIADLKNSVEVVLDTRGKIRKTDGEPRGHRPRQQGLKRGRPQGQSVWDTRSPRQ